MAQSTPKTTAARHFNGSSRYQLNTQHLPLAPFGARNSASVNVPQARIVPVPSVATMAEKVQRSAHQTPSQTGEPRFFSYGKERVNSRHWRSLALQLGRFGDSISVLP
jgi:hypothetical protein